MLRPSLKAGQVCCGLGTPAFTSYCLRRLIHRSVLVRLLRSGCSQQQGKKGLEVIQLRPWGGAHGFSLGRKASTSTNISSCQTTLCCAGSTGLQCRHPPSRMSLLPCASQIAQKHIRVPHTACPVHAYDEAKSKGRARDLPLVALQHPAAAATPRSVRPGQLPSHQTSGQAQGSFGSETGLASGVSPLPRASPVSEKGQQQQQRQLPEASQDHVSSANLLDSSDASYQLGTYDSLDKSVRGK